MLAYLILYMKNMFQIKYYKSKGVLSVISVQFLIDVVLCTWPNPKKHNLLTMKYTLVVLNVQLTSKLDMS